LGVPQREKKKMGPRKDGELAYLLGEAEDHNPYDAKRQWANWYHWLLGYANAYQEDTGKVFVSKHREFHTSPFA
jgi:hypothetical protein